MYKRQPDDYTLVFTCKDPCPYFDTVAAYTSFYPVSEDLINELGIEGFRACDYTNMWYNGPYVVEEFISQNTKSYIPNPNYYDAANVSRFERFTVTMISDGSISLQLYQNRELDEVDLGESNITTIQSDPSNEYNQQLCEKRAKKFSYCFIFNYDKKNTDGTPDENWNKAIANKAFDQQLEDDQSRERRGLYLRTEYDSCACEELRQQVFDLVRRDAAFLPGFIPTYFELELGRSSEQLLEYAGVPVRGKVDRVDVDAEGNAVIIDYKLSGLSAGYGFGRDDELPQRIQTDIYATLVERHFAALGTPLHVVGSVYRSYAKNALRGVYARGIPWGDTEQLREDFDALPRAGSDEGYDAYLTRVEDVLASCVERLRAGDIAPAPLSSDVCEYCKAASFCPRGGA